MTPTSKTPSTAVKEVVKIGLPPVGVAMAFHSAIKAEDRQRRLGNAAKFLDDHPFAQSLAKSLEAGAEEKKNKAAIVGTVSFVAMGATAHLALIAQPGLKAIGNPITAAVGRGVSHELTGHMSHVGTQVMSTSSSNVSGRVVSEVQNRTATSVMPSGPGVSRTTKAEPIEVPLPEGTSAPTIPVQIQTDEGPRTKEFDMSTAGPALLHYVGSQVGDTSDPHEQNRKELRDLLGARPEDDFDPNRKASPEDRELDERIAAALDDPTQPGAAELIRSVSLLRLLYIAQGWR